MLLVFFYHYEELGSGRGNRLTSFTLFEYIIGGVRELMWLVCGWYDRQVNNAFLTECYKI